MGSALRKGAQLFGKSDTRARPVVEAVVDVGLRAFPVKVARQLAARAGVSHRSVEAWMAQSNGMSADALAELLRSDIGRDILDAVMAGSRPAWWPEFDRATRLADLERRANAAHREIRELKLAQSGASDRGMAASGGGLFSGAGS